MEINLGSNIGGNIGALNDAVGANVNNVGGKTSDASRLSRLSANLTIDRGADAIASAEPTAEISADALSRDDDLGKLVNAAFSLPAPPMPDFGT